jgi:hypothetical protein
MRNRPTARQPLPNCSFSSNRSPEPPSPQRCARHAITVRASLVVQSRGIGAAAGVMGASFSPYAVVWAYLCVVAPVSWCGAAAASWCEAVIAGSVAVVETACRVETYSTPNAFYWRAPNEASSLYGMPLPWRGFQSWLAAYSNLLGSPRIVHASCYSSPPPLPGRHQFLRFSSTSTTSG